MRSTSACCCRGPRRCSSRPTSAGGCTALKGGLAAGLLFVLPGALMMLVLSMLYAAFGKLPLAEALLTGVKAAVLAVVVEALLRIARRALKGNVDWALAALAFIAIYLFAVPFPVIVLAAALFGFWRGLGATSPATAVASSARCRCRRRWRRPRSGWPSGCCRCSASPGPSAATTCWRRSAGSSPSSPW